jgi:predicted enzyme involved in methoxymalonyl-ACP biosynthesis
LHKVIGEYIPSRKNKMVSSFYEDHGFKTLRQNSDGAVTYEKSIDAQ